jgi:hypothetical protein
MWTDVWKFLFGGGALAFAYAVGKGVQWISSRAAVREDKLEKQVERWQRDMTRRARWEGKQHDYWRAYAGDCEHVIRTRLGEEALPKRKPYPQEPKDPEETDAEAKAKDK